VHGHLSERLGTPTVGAAWHEIDRRLEERGVSEEVRAKIARSLEQSDYARFAPGADGNQAMDDLRAETLSALEELGRELRVRRGRQR
jgi:hypothetical protein